MNASYGLTPAFLVGSPSVSPFLAMMLNAAFVSPFLGLGAWLQQGEQLPEQPSSLFEMAHGKKPWDLASRDPAFTSLFNEGMEESSRCQT